MPVKGVPFEESVRKASGFVKECVQRSIELDLPATDGLCFEEKLHTLFKRINISRSLTKETAMKKKAMTILYEVHNGLYVNLTNRCSCACTFCVRQTDDAVGKSDTLWLEHEPSFEEVMEAFNAFNMDKYEELVFCGFGEPTEAFDTLKQVASEAKRLLSIPVPE